MDGKVVYVLIPFFNREGYLGEALESIENQTYENWCPLFYDDGSTDDGHLLVREFIRKHGRGDLVRSSQNKGVGHARNQLLSMVDTSSAYVCWQDSDDWSHPERLEKQVALIESDSRPDMVFTYLQFFKEKYRNPNKGIYSIDVSRYKNRQGLYNNMAFATGLFRSWVARYKFNEIRRKEDVHWILSMYDKVKFDCVDEPLYRVRRHPDRLTGSAVTI